MLNTPKDCTYHRTRADEEDAQAEETSSPAATIAHRKLAELHRVKEATLLEAEYSREPAVFGPEPIVRADKEA